MHIKPNGSQASTKMKNAIGTHLKIPFAPGSSPGQALSATARDGGSADFAGAKICRPPGMVEVQILQEQKSADRQG